MSSRQIGFHQHGFVSQDASFLSSAIIPQERCVYPKYRLKKDELEGAKPLLNKLIWEKFLKAFLRPYDEVAGALFLCRGKDELKKLKNNNWAANGFIYPVLPGSDKTPTG